MGTDIQVLARRFVDATVNKWGTDEEAVFKILKTVHDQKVQAQFEADVYELSRRPVNLILNDELDGSQLTRAEDLLKFGRETFRSGYLNYFAEGVVSVFDWSSTESKVVVGGGIALTIGLTLLAPPVGFIVGGGLLILGAGMGAIDLTLGGFAILASDSEEEAKKGLVLFGQGVTKTVLFLPPVLAFTKGFGKGFVQSWRKRTSIIEGNQ